MLHMPTNTTSDYSIINIPVDKIRSNPYQPRRTFDHMALEELAASIREFGVLQPISVRHINGNSYELVAGERRLRACKIVGATTIPAVVLTITDRDSALLALIENLQRENLNFLEESEGYSNLIRDYGLTQEELALKVGKSQSTIANKMRLLKLAPIVKKMIIDHDLSERHARALLKLPEEQLQLKVLQKVVQEGLTVKRTEELVDKVIQRLLDEKEEKKEQKVKTYLKDIRLFTNTIQQAINVMHQAGVEAKYEMEEKEDCYEITIRIPTK
ncbi:MAG: nucleoid occlusion protein [Epulopiscium sp.]|nr:nucleoid occlusion protein [Candidatus Epulonipiscium sp.]